MTDMTGQAASAADIDWSKDPWFAKYWAQNLTDGFKVWWIGYYGPPSDFEDSFSEQSEYWGRCGFSLAGWSAALAERNGK